MLYTQPPLTTPENIANAAKDSLSGKNINWYRLLGLYGYIDIDRTTLSDVICIKPNSTTSLNDLKIKTDWLRPYSEINKLIPIVIKNMDLNIKNYEEFLKTKQG